MEASAPGIAPPPPPPFPLPFPFRYRASRKGDELQFAAGCIAMIAGVILLLIVPLSVYLLGVERAFGWSGGVFLCLAGAQIALSVLVFWSAASAFRFTLRTGWGFIGEGLACIAAGLFLFGGLISVFAGVLLLIAGGLTFAS